MRAALIAAALIASAAFPAHAVEPDIKKAGSFLQAYYGNGDNSFARLYIIGVTDGIAAVNVYLFNKTGGATGGGVTVYCPPRDVSVVDAQYAQILRDFLDKHDNMKDKPTYLVLLLALVDAFPCKKQ